MAFFQVNNRCSPSARRNRDSAARPRQRSPALESAGDQHDRQPDEQQRDGAVEHPVGQAELMDQQVNEAQHSHARRPRTATRLAPGDSFESPPRCHSRPPAWSRWESCRRCSGLSAARAGPATHPRSATDPRDASRGSASGRCSSWADTAGRCLVTGSGAWVMCAASRACGVGATNGVRPVSIS